MPFLTSAQTLGGDLNRTPNTAYYFSNYNFGSISAPTITVTPPSSCTGTATITVNWNKNISGTVIRSVNMHGGIDYDNNIISSSGGSTLSSSNSYTYTYTNLEPGIYTFGLYRDPYDDNLTTNNSGAGASDDYTIDGWNSTDGDQQRCAVFGVIILPVNNNKLTTLTVDATSASDCVTSNGSITINGLKTNTSYQVATLVNGSYSTYTSSANGVITLSGLLPGYYPVRIRRNGESCYRQVNMQVNTQSETPCYLNSQSTATGTNMIANGNFGSSSGTLPSNSTTDYTFTSSIYGRPGDSEYRLDNSTDYTDNGYNVTTEHNYRLRNLTYPTQSRHIYSCFQNSKDHTGSNGSADGTSNGYMMLVNANYKTDRVVEISSLSLTAGKIYRLTFWAKNLQPFMPKNKNNATTVGAPTYQPIVPRIAVTLNGRIYQFSDLSVAVEPSTYTSNTILNQMGWEMFSVSFTSPVTSTSNSVGIYNFQQGGFGNDFLIDDISMYEMVTFSGKVFDDADGNVDTKIDGVALSAPSGTALYAYLVNGSGVIIDVVQVNSDGTYVLTGASSTNYTVRISTQILATGATAPSSSSLPSDWVHTAEQFGTNNNSGNGIESGTANGVIAARSTGSNVTQINFGLNKRPESDNYSFSIPNPIYNQVKSLTSANSLDTLSGSDLEDGRRGQNNSFKVTSTTGMNGNTLFYDTDNDNVVDAGETLSAGSTLNNYQASKLKVKFNGMNSTSFSFQYTTIDSACFEDLTPANYTVTWITPVPVKLIYIEATASGEKAIINWATASETNNDYFEVLRSRDGKSWGVIGIVDGNGNSQSVLKYSFVDENPESMNYYRLRQVDFDGKSEFSPIRQLDFNASLLNVLVYPNPGNGQITVNFNKQPEHELQIRVINVQGAVEHEAMIAPLQTLALDLSHLKHGYYFLQIVNGEEIINQKLVIQ